jgi:hypothetical protein
MLEFARCLEDVGYGRVFRHDRYGHGVLVMAFSLFPEFSPFDTF